MKIIAYFFYKRTFNVTPLNFVLRKMDLLNFHRMLYVHFTLCRHLRLFIYMI